MTSSNKPLLFRMVRPSLLDQRFTCDLGLVEQNDGSFSLRLGDYSLADIRCNTLDVPALNAAIDRMRHPRHRRRTA
jgi:hypothetical protein